MDCHSIWDSVALNDDFLHALAFCLLLPVKRQDSARCEAVFMSYRAAKFSSLSSQFCWALRHWKGHQHSRNPVLWCVQVHPTFPVSKVRPAIIFFAIWVCHSSARLSSTSPWTFQTLNPILPLRLPPGNHLSLLSLTMISAFTFLFASLWLNPWPYSSCSLPFIGLSARAAFWYQAFDCLDLAIGCHIFELFGLSVNLWIFPLVPSLLCCNWVHTRLYLYLIPNVTYL